MSKKTLGVVAILIILAGITTFAIYSNPEMRNRICTLMGQEKIEAKKVIVTQKEIIALVQDSMQIFAISVNQKDMSNFYSSTADYWQKRTSIAELNKIFNPFIKAGVDLTALEKMQPIIDKRTRVTKKKDLYIVGHYNTKPSVVRFKQTYKHQKSGDWKLVEFFVEIK